MIPRDDKPDTWFLPAAKADAVELARIVALVADSPVVGAITRVVRGMVLVINEQRQIVATNDAFLEMVSAESAEDVIGLRVGETLECSFREDWDGCGTTKACRTCGAALATALAQKSEEPQDSDCVLTVRSGDSERHVVLNVRASPLRIEDTDLTLVVLADVTAERRRVGLEQVMLHDLANALAPLFIIAELAADEQSLAVLHRLRGELRVHGALTAVDPKDANVQLLPISLGDAVSDTVAILRKHPAAAGRFCEVALDGDLPLVNADKTLVGRVVTNMIINAFEATKKGGTVRLSASVSGDGVQISVHNAGFMPVGVAPRVFQPQFSTKGGPGRGLGTYSMKVLGEELLGGRISFTSSESEGTTFRFWLSCA